MVFNTASEHVDSTTTRPAIINPRPAFWSAHRTLSTSQIAAHSHRYSWFCVGIPKSPKIVVPTTKTSRKNLHPSTTTQRHQFWKIWVGSLFRIAILYNSRAHTFSISPLPAKLSRFFVLCWFLMFCTSRLFCTSIFGSVLHLVDFPNTFEVPRLFSH